MKIFILSLLIILPILVIAQDDPMQRVLKRMEDLEKELRRRDSLTYIKNRNLILTSFSKSTDLLSDFENIQASIELSSIFNDFNEVNSPTSSVLGFKFTDVIMKAAENNFEKHLPENEKPRFKDFVNKLIKNPILNSILNSNPISSMVTNVISWASNFSTTNPIIARAGKTIKDVSLQTKNVFDEEKIENFVIDIKPYINFYTSLNLANERYRNGIVAIKDKHSILKTTVGKYRSILFEDLGIIDRSLPIHELIRLLPEATASSNLTFSTYVNNDKINNAVLTCYELPALQQGVADFKKDYNKLLNDYFDNYIHALNVAKKELPVDNKDNITSMVTKIENYKLTLSTNKGVVDVFQNKK